MRHWLEQILLVSSLVSIIFTARSFWIIGSAMLRDDPINGIKKEPSATTMSAVFLTFFVINFIINHYDQKYYYLHTP